MGVNYNYIDYPAYVIGQNFAPAVEKWLSTKNRCL